MNKDEGQNIIDELLLEGMKQALKKQGIPSDLYIDGKIKGIMFAVDIIKEHIK